ncbi:MAG: hypothetical protein JWO38_8082 [Gemmataceae bacterium]|nr:hypothetical protein [Gemmataceae bacterium]
MAQFSLSIGRWRMVRIALRKKRTRFEDLRSMARRDQSDVDWLVANGFFNKVGDGLYELTDKGRDAADQGFYEWQPSRPAASAAVSTPVPTPAAQPGAAPKTPKNRGKK